MAKEGILGSAERPTEAIRVNCQRTVFPAHQAHPQRVDLSVFDLNLLLVDYDQRGLLYEMPAHSFSSAIDHLEKSLSLVLVHFYPLAGRLCTSPSDGAKAHIDCNDAGAAFIEAIAENLTVSDIMAAAVPTVVYELFPLKNALNIEGHRLPLLAVQVTQLRDGIFVCSINHAVLDGLSLWHFFNSWAEICGGAETISVHPIHNRWASPAARPNLNPDAVYERFSPPVFKARMFHFSEGVIKGLKDRANRELTESPISSLQALCAHVWQAITRARQLGPEEPTTFQLAINCRARLVPPLPAFYFGSAIQATAVTTTVCELASKDVVFPARLLHGLIRSHGDRTIRERIDRWDKNPVPLDWANLLKKKNLVVMGSSPLFRIYENDFGWGKPVAVRSGCGNKTDGKVQMFAGKDGGGSMVLEICLVPKTMQALELDEHFLNPLIV